MIAVDYTIYKGQLSVKKQDGKRWIFDQIRRKYLVLQPEEFVRQLVICYLLKERAYNHNRIAIEKKLEVNGMTKRCDILVFQKDMQPWLLVECKAPGVVLSEATFRQVAMYNMPLQVQYLMVTNGHTTYCCRMDYAQNEFEFLDEIPAFEP